ncbi:uncharacterized protein BO66DRAFT_393818 [Aspergillus aculeatinus CBS 121060]|uniref:Uncharacterized protein n=1 Tax=Aspergillus aculeatinus CBS 121060 TaxID=1448322 RepID=A0ACD1H0U2_9EURO|nr:hypothetical protein BO66DRAFT_393818 [Aspergillus aculeatinus CBS 121060]RAH67367.1 hypothetical protein BO66DRAFT_393818 [Aspergillus aculeatinus CBS 121060]
MSSWTPETIIALVTLIATAPSSLLVLWDLYLRRYRRRHSSPQPHRFVHADSDHPRFPTSPEQHFVSSNLIMQLPPDAQFYCVRDFDVQMRIQQFGAHVVRSYDRS